MTDEKKSIPVVGTVGKPPTTEQAVSAKATLPVSKPEIPPKPVPTATEKPEKDTAVPAVALPSKEAEKPAAVVEPKVPTIAADSKTQAAPTTAKIVTFPVAGKEVDKNTAPTKEPPVADNKEKKDVKTHTTDKPPQEKATTAEKSAPAKSAPPRDKLSQSKVVEPKKTEKEAPAKDKTSPAESKQSSKPRDATRSKKLEQIVYINLSELHPFKNHPFGVRDDAEMNGLVESVKASGVNQPALVRPREDGGYEIVAGHRRQRASELAGFVNMPCIVRSMTDDEAILAMTDDNLRHREKILPMEKAQSLKMQVEAIKHQGGPGLGEDAGKRSTEIVGERNGINYKQVQRYIRLTELVPELQKMVDEKGLSFTPAVEISFIKPKHQKYIAVSIEGQQASPSLSQAQQLRSLDKDNKLNPDIIDGILSQEKKKEDRNVIINGAELEKYFGKEATPRQMKDQIMALLDDWKAKQPPELAKPEKKTEKSL